MLRSQIKDVTIIKKANVYFDGKVTSRTVVFPNSSRKTLGIMLPGEYEFNTDDKEIIEIISGDLDVLIIASEGWKTIKNGEEFEVPPKSKFSINVKSITDYCCSYIKTE